MAFRRPQGLVARDSACGGSLLRLRVLALRNDGGFAPFSNGIVALSGAAVIGGLPIATISNIFDLRGVAAGLQLIMKGLLILLAVYLT